MKFSEGDRVVVTNQKNRFNKDFYGDRHGRVAKLKAEHDYPYGVVFDGGGFLAFQEDELIHEADSSSDQELVSGEEVNSPSHYTSHPSGIEAKEIVGHYPFFIGSAMKYLWRADLKTKDWETDFRKAIRNIEMEIERRRDAA